MSFAEADLPGLELCPHGEMRECCAGYFVTSDGRVFSNKRSSMRQIIPSLSRYGYLHIKTWTNGIATHWRVNRLVAIAWIGEPPSLEHEVRHIDGIRTNNNVSNLG